MSRQEIRKPQSKIEITTDYRNQFNIPEGDEVVDFTLHEVVGPGNGIILLMGIYEAPETGTDLVFSYVKTNGEIRTSVERVYTGSRIDTTFLHTMKLSVSAKGPLKGGYNSGPRCIC
ncbi:hypothetical protein COI63_34520 [Bacillus toyonensis]|uniref:hypothetical protein n=1 Tax=Bacillus toyonensis TaxID=155322 RepID=UPI000BF0CCE8|nr:hypothetical protein [Bacillus toyonensis]PEK71993.1 hypothetical protein CN594_34945 [Bacillus toyonensis]PGD13412.1 hypothetical protein COM37_27905 [Bacillus toyonensis]PHD27973.1 hypothetical protein COF75_35325 [Bacillus toyonensis]PHF87650.1 hypothetical protein COI63_34520 [Bacillus toyonensis]